jgi:NAD-dependent DNA ligase
MKRSILNSILTHHHLSDLEVMALSKAIEEELEREYNGKSVCITGKCLYVRSEMELLCKSLGAHIIKDSEFIW